MMPDVQMGGSNHETGVDVEERDDSFVSISSNDSSSAIEPTVESVTEVQASPIIGNNDSEEARAPPRELNPRRPVNYKQ